MGPTETTPETEEIEGLELEFFHLSFAVGKSRRYHESRCKFFSKWRDRMKIITAISGSGAFVLVSGKIEFWASAISAFVALWAVLDIIVAPDKKADLHKLLCEQFVELASRIANAPLDENSLHELQSIRLRIEKQEPPVNRILDIISRNEECRARDMFSEIAPLSTGQYYLVNYFPYGLKKLDDWRDSRGLISGAS